MVRIVLPIGRYKPAIEVHVVSHSPMHWVLGQLKDFVGFERPANLRLPVEIRSLETKMHDSWPSRMQFAGRGGKS